MFEIKAVSQFPEQHKSILKLVTFSHGDISKYQPIWILERSYLMPLCCHWAQKKYF